MSDRFVPVQARVFDDLNIGTPSEDQPSPFIDGEIAHLVYDLSNYQEENGVLRRQPVPVAEEVGSGDLKVVAKDETLSPTQQTSGTLLGQDPGQIRELKSLGVTIRGTSSVTDNVAGLIRIALRTPVPQNYWVVAADFQYQADEQLDAGLTLDVDGIPVEGDFQLRYQVQNDVGSDQDFSAELDLAYTERPA